MAIFRKKTFRDYVCLVCGLFLIGLFIFAGYKDREATFGEILTGVILGTIIFSFSTIIMFFNFRAFLTIENGCIKGKYHYFGRIDCKVSDVVFAMPQIYTLSILLKNGKRHVIMGIENPWPLATAIRQQIFTMETEAPDTLLLKLETEQLARKKKLRWVLCCVVLMFANIFIAVFLTSGKEMHNFSKVDWILFSIMGVLEILTFIASFYFAGRCGKHLLPIEQLKHRVKGAYIASQTLPSGNVKRIYTDENHTGRIVVCGYPNDESVYYCVQVFVGNYLLKTVHTSEIYASEADLPNEAPSSLIDITDYFQ